MNYLLDTNAWVDYLNTRQSSVAQRLSRFHAKHIRLCSIVKAELYYGACKSSRVQENLALLGQVFRKFASVPFDDNCAEIYGRIRVDLESQGRRIGPHDLLIASIALGYNLTLVTHNTSEFSRVSGLSLEDWEG